MKIAVLGAPGAGKSKFARGLSKHRGSQSVTVVDNYVQQLQKRTGLALGPWASYSENFMIAGVRDAKERSVKPADYRITVGTILDTIVYGMVRTDVVIHGFPAERQMVYQHAQSAVNGLSLWYTETWDYDVAFFLPLADGERTWERSINDAYGPVVEEFFVPNVFSLEGEAKERVQIASEVITVLEREQTDTDEAEAPATVE